MSAEQVEDGNLPAARRYLEDAIAELVDPRPGRAGSSSCRECHNESCDADCKLHTCLGHLTWIDSRYTQLQDARDGNEGSWRGQAKSKPPAWTDAVQLLDEIDFAVSLWRKDPGPFDGDLTETPTPETVRRLKLFLKQGITGSGWRPQDTTKMKDITANVASWVEDIDDLLSPARVFYLMAAQGKKPAACPQCGEHTVYKTDSAGERVRRPALQVADDGSTRCGNFGCGAYWGPDQALFVCRLLGYALPEGVLE